MSLIGHVFNKALGKAIPVFITDSGPGFKRLTGVIDESVKSSALALVKDRFENGSLFKVDDMKQMEQLTITNMFHKSSTDPNEHLSVQGEVANGVKVKGGHAAVDELKQTQAK